MPLNLALEPLFGWFGGSEDGVRLEKIQHAEAVHGRAHHDLRAVELELRRDNRALHDLKRSKHGREAAGRVGRLGAWAAGDIDRNQQVGRGRSDGQTAAD